MFRVTKCFILALFVCVTFLAPSVLAQRPTPTQSPQSRGSVPSPLEGGDPTVNINVYVLGSDGGPIEVTAVVTLIAATGQVLSQGTTLAGNIQFNGVAANNCTIQVVAPGYETTVKEFDSYSAAAARINIQMQPASNGGAGAGSTRILLAPKVQKELGKALEALRANKPDAARGHLDAAYRKAPNHPAVNYLFGVYFLQMKDQEKAKSYWTKALEFDPKYASALLALTETLAQEGKLSDAESYGKRAVEADPSGWRGHAILANVLLKEHSSDAAIKEAERALELGHGQAASVQPLLARALAENGNEARAINVLQTYVQEHPSDAAARRQLDQWRTPAGTIGLTVRPVAAEVTPSIALEVADPIHEPELSPSSPKAQEALDRAFKLMGTTMTPEQTQWARTNLETAYKIAPTSADVNYLFGVYSWQTYDRARAIAYWTKAVEFYPRHYRALLSLGQALVDDEKLGEALPYLEQAQQVEPFSWRPYALSAHVYLRQGLSDKAAKQAERALELGHEEAAIAQRYLAAALAKRGEKDKAVGILQSYVRGHRSDSDAKKQLEKLQAPAGKGGQDTAEGSSEQLLQSAAVTTVTPMPLPPGRWLPPDVDHEIPPVEPVTICSLDQVLQKAGKRVQEFVKNVDRFTAREFLEHESIDKWGFAGLPETRKFDYVASIEQYKPGHFSVTEYRTGVQSNSEFPDGIATNGLPALALIFHPSNAENFEMSCEGLSRMSGGLAWQVHFRQRPDRPNTMREYRIGEYGPSYPVALRGRAWIAADSYQIVRMETDLVATVPQIRLLTDHTIVEYGPVHFRKHNVEMWLPQSAELYCDWRGKRMHRRLSFSNYLLFSVDEKQNIAPPKEQTGSQPKVDSGSPN